jgi:type VI secretion system protein ImpK
MIEAMYWTCADAMTLAAQLADAQELPPPDVLRQRINVLFSSMSQRGKQAGITDTDLRDATYAIAALMDEQLLRSNWTGRTAWMAQPLQLTYFNENTAGEGFFQRLSALEQSPGQEHLVQIYYLCLALGFRGRYAVAGVGDVQAEQEHARNIVAQRLPPSEVISGLRQVESVIWQTAKSANHSCWCCHLCRVCCRLCFAEGYLGVHCIYSGGRHQTLSDYRRFPFIVAVEKCHVDLVTCHSAFMRHLGRVLGGRAH